MRLPRQRFTVRRLMLVVALGGLVIGSGVWGVRMSRLSGEYAGKAQHYIILEDYHPQYVASRAEQAQSHEKLAAGNRPVDNAGNEPLTHATEKLEKDFAAQARDDLEQAALAGAMADYCAALVRKYKRAARFPWLPVEPDPPEPWPIRRTRLQ